MRYVSTRDNSKEYTFEEVFIKGLADDGKKIVDEGMDIIQSISASLKDGKITNEEKNQIVKEIKDFSKVSIEAIEKLSIPE